MATTRVQRSAAATLSHTWYVDESPTDPTGTPTYAIADANGVAVASGNATVVTGEGRTTLPLSGQSAVAWYTVTWSATVGGHALVEYDQVEIVGGYLFTLADARASDESLGDTSKYPTADLKAKRLETEVECEQICDQAWAVRYRRLVLDGTGLSDLPVPDGGDVHRGGILLRGVRTVRRAAIAPTLVGTFVDLTGAQLAAVAVTADGKLRRTDGHVWTEGIQNVVLEYEFGNDAPPEDLQWAAKQRLRQRLNLNKSGVPERASSYTVDGGGTYRIAMPGPYETGSPEVDAAYARYSRRATGGTDGKPAPAGVTVTYEPQRYSLYHRR